MTDTQTTQVKKGAPHISDADFQKTLDGSSSPILVDFFAEWCGPCKLAAPIIDKLSDEFQGKMTIVKLDVDANPETAKKYGVMSIPTVLVFKKEGNEVKEVDRKIGFPGEEGYRQMISKATMQ